MLLILGGTGEARALAAELAGLPVLSSLAGRVSDPRLPAGETRIGGFGGTAGLAAFLTAERVRGVIDATHPFAPTISAHAHRACAASGVPLLVLTRPPYDPDPRWVRVADVAAGAAAITRPGPVLLTTGRRDLAAFASDATRRYVVRTVDPPERPLPPDHVLVRGRGPYSAPAERALMTAHRIETLVSKDSGGAMTVAKLAVAAELGITVVMVDRPPAPTARTTHDVAAAAAWARAVVG